MADEWSPPTEDSSTDYRAPQQGFEALLSRLRRLAARVAALEGSAPLRQAGVTVKSLGLWVDRALHVSGDFTSAGSADITGATHIGGATDIDGTLNVDANTTIGGTLGVTGNTTLGAPTTISGALTVTGGTTITGSTSIGGALGVGGTATITGALQSSNYVAGVSGYRLTPTTIEMNDLAIKAKAVPDAALSSIIKGAAKNNYQSGTYGAGTYSLASVTFTVPSDVERVSIMGTSSITINGTNNVSIECLIAGSAGYPVIVNMDAGASAGNGTTSYARDFAVTPGASVTVSTRIGPVSSTTVLAVTSATAIFYR